MSINKAVLFWIVLLVLVSQMKAASITSRSKDERFTRYTDLLEDYFSRPRHPFRNEEAWQRARQGVINLFQGILYQVPNTTLEVQDFLTEIMFQPNIPGPIQGQNIIVTFEGTNRWTGNDEIVLIGAHYDSDGSSSGVDDNGSGVVAMLEVARALADAVKNKKAVVKNTVIFVAFDVQRFEHAVIGVTDQKSGSMYYVQEKLDAILSTEPAPKFRGAIILDGVLNFINSEGTQILPNGFDLSFPEGNRYVLDNRYKGNFLAMINKDNLRTTQLDSFFHQQWNLTDERKNFPLLSLEVRRSLPSTPALFEFLKQDHLAFWNYAKGNIPKPLPAILLTDTGKWRGMGSHCNPIECNVTSILTKDHLNLLDQVVYSIDRFISNTQVDGSIDLDNAGNFVFTSMSTFLLTVIVPLLLS